ncbi:MAG: hypothetical protein ACYDA1_00575 [Vulcanimicrobiaceae bacterium]
MYPVRAIDLTTSVATVALVVITHNPTAATILPLITSTILDAKDRCIPIGSLAISILLLTATLPHVAFVDRVALTIIAACAISYGAWQTLRASSMPPLPFADQLLFAVAALLAVQNPFAVAAAFALALGFFLIFRPSTVRIPMGAILGGPLAVCLTVQAFILRGHP